MRRARHQGRVLWRGRELSLGRQSGGATNCGCLLPPVPHARGVTSSSFSTAGKSRFVDGKDRAEAPDATGRCPAGGGVRSGEGALPEGVVERTRQWADKVVIGLRLCPFARMDETRIVCAPPDQARDIDSFLDLLRSEVQVLRDQPQVASTLVALPHVKDFASFEVFNAAVNIATEDLSTDEEGNEVETVHQIAQFHPEFAYEGEDTASVENYTSRSPYPTVHLIRASLITAARERYGEDYLLRLPEANSKRLQTLGLEQVRKLCPSAGDDGGSEHSTDAKDHPRSSPKTEKASRR